MINFDSEKSRKLSGLGDFVTFSAKCEDDRLFSIVSKTGNDVRSDAGSNDATQRIFFRHENVAFVVARVGE